MAKPSISAIDEALYDAGRLAGLLAPTGDERCGKKDDAHAWNVCARIEQQEDELRRTVEMATG